MSDRKLNPLNIHFERHADHSSDGRYLLMVIDSINKVNEFFAFEKNIDIQ